MGPSSQRYTYTYKYTDLCDKKKVTEEDVNSIYDVIRKDPRFTKTLKMIEMALLKNYLNTDGDGYTIFITEDKNIPDEWMAKLDTFRAQNFINSYIITGQADKDYIIKNGSSVYIPRKYHYNNPILAIVENDTIVVNKTGKWLYQIQASNGFVHVLDNIAEITYIN